MKPKIQEFHDIINFHEFMKCFVTAHIERLTVLCHYPRTFFFTPATVEEVRRIIISSPNKCCDIDPVPTVLLTFLTLYLV